MNYAEIQAEQEQKRRAFLALPADKKLAILQQCRQSLTNHVARGATMKARRSMDLVDRYNEIRTWLLQSDSLEDVHLWDRFCDDLGFDYRHNGYDSFA